MEHISNPTNSFKEILEILFEKQEMARGNCFFAPLLASLATGGAPEKSRIIIDSGEKLTTAVPIYGFTMIIDSITRTEAAGGLLNSILTHQMAVKEPCRQIEPFFTRILKENHLRISKFRPKHPSKMQILQNNFHKKHVELPDESVVYLGNEIYQVCEALFHPKMFGNEADSIQHILAQCIRVMIINLF